MANNISRRGFINQTAKTTVAVAAASVAGVDLLAGCT